MQYYRLWIYSCNGVLGLTSAIFTVFAAFVLADVRLTLLGGVELDHPTFVYACAALILQCGVLQTIGCLGAQRLSHKLLSVYWILLLLLTIGDVVVGLVWVFKLDKMKQNLRPGLTKEFISRYKRDIIFTATWDKVQSQEHCCGVNGPMDFGELSESLPFESSDLNFVLSNSKILYLPDSCCTYIYVPVSTTHNGRGPLTASSASAHFPSFGSQLHSTSTSKTTTIGALTTTPTTQTSAFSTFHFNYSNDNDAIAMTTPDILRDNHSVEKNLVGDIDDGGGDELEKNRPILEPMLLPLVLNTNVDNNFENMSTVLSVTNLTFYSTTITSAQADEPITPASLSSLNKQLSHKRRHFNHKRNKHLTSGSPTPLTVTTTYDENAVLTGDTENSIDFETNLPEIVTSTKVSGEIRSTDKTIGHPSDPNSAGVKSLATEGKSTENYGEGHSTVSYVCQRHQYHSHRTSSTSSSTGLTDVDNQSSTSTSYITNFPSSSTVIPDSTHNSPVNLTPMERLRRKRNALPEASSPDYGESTVYSETEYSTIFADLETTTGSPQNDDGTVERSYFPPINRKPADQLKQFIPYRIGCGFKLVAWLDHVSGIMFILGFCIIGFVKTCFLVILKTEIREMIEKIHMLEIDLPVSPTRSTQHKYHHHPNPHPHPLLSNPHRASTVSAGGGYAGLPLIKSPEGPLASTSRGRGYNYTSYNRRPSNFERERSQSHSQETVNMTLLITSASIAPTPERHPHQRHFRSNSNANTCSLTHNTEDTSLSIRVPKTRRSSSASVTTYTAPGFPHSLSPQPGPSSRFYHQPFSTTSAGSNSSASASGCPTSYNHPPHIKHLGVLNPGTQVGGYGCNSSFSSRDENEILSVSMENLEEVGGDEQAEQDHNDERRREQEIRNWVAVAGNAGADNHNRHDHKAADFGASRSHQNNSSISSNGSNERQRRNGNNNVDCNCIPMSFLGTAV